MLKAIVMIEGNLVLDQRVFKTEAHAISFASKMQDRGYKVRIIDL